MQHFKCLKIDTFLLKLIQNNNEPHIEIVNMFGISIENKEEFMVATINWLLLRNLNRRSQK